MNSVKLLLNQVVRQLCRNSTEQLAKSGDTLLPKACMSSEMDIIPTLRPAEAAKFLFIKIVERKLIWS